MSIRPVPRVGVIVVAAGSGTRLGAGTPKAFVDLDGRSILSHALEGVFATPVGHVVVVAPAERAEDARREALEASAGRGDVVSVVAGGSTRQASVAAGLAALPDDVGIVLVHDAARALTPPEVFERVAAAVEGGASGVIPVLPVVDTLKRVTDGEIVGGVDRSELAAAQTPQGFPRHVLDAAYAGASAEFTDDAALVADAGHAVAAVPGHPLAFKITTPADLDRAQHLLASPRAHLQPRPTI
ncbi:MAG: 2-C-methyl-D-erythritol 4-phosphate cytidylyltransferase, partial [Actinomycetota bacterium]|nr:2-C-methyl-D-erythritol 4-phosphate cytidylyltransferase [Actinomycetota bacterium]